jgi:hypothetical protein
MTIEDYFLGHWNNRHQCITNPTEFSNIHILWERIDGGFRSRSWRHREKIENSYRDQFHKFVKDGPYYRLETYDHSWTIRTGCDIILTPKPNGWHGSDQGTCYKQDVLVQTKLEVTRDYYRVFDYGSRNGKPVFGQTKYFVFKRVG